MKKLLLCLIVSVSLIPIRAQSIPGISIPAPQAQPASASDPLGRDTPSGTVLGFLQAAQNGNTRAAADYLQMSPARRQAQVPVVALAADCFGERLLPLRRQGDERDEDPCSRRRA